MIVPDAETFVALGRRHGVVPLSSELLADLDTPLSVYARLRGDGPSFLLESAEHGERWGRFSFVGTDPFLVLTGDAGSVRAEGDVPVDVTGLGILDALERVLAVLDAPPLADVPLHAGAVGYLGYDVVREVELLPEGGPDVVGMPDATLVFPRHVVALDHLRQRMTLVTNAVTAGVAPERLATVHAEALAAHERLVARVVGARADAVPVEVPVPVAVDDVPSNLPPGGFEERVERVKEHVAAGDVFQIVLSQRFSTPTTAEALDLYRVLRVINPSPYLYLLDLGEAQVIGSSPEALVRVQGRQVESWPIAGTRARGATVEEDRERELELVNDAKERAEHVMLVDLARNDLGRVAEPGSVRVASMMRVERYSHVMHLVSEVTATLRPDVGVVDVLRATLPAGTVSGAPKVRAMELIAELEPDRRGVYAGAVGYVDLAGNLDTCITIRTVVLRDGVAHVQAGAGIVADSVPASEERETRHKAGAVLAAIRAAEGLRGGGTRTLRSTDDGAAP